MLRAGTIVLARSERPPVHLVNAMNDAPNKPAGVDFSEGVPLSQLPEGSMVGGHAQGTPVLVARIGAEVFAIDAHCTHYGGPLAEGLLVGETVRCPWHHACFSLRTGEALRPPALKPVNRWSVQQRDGVCYVTGEVQQETLAVPPRPLAATSPASVVIVGAGAAGNAAAEMLRRDGYGGTVTMIGAEDSVPYDRPNLSKDYLAGSAPEEWIPLRSEAFYRDQEIRLALGRRVMTLDLPGGALTLDDSSALPFEALLLATGAEPRRLPEAVDPEGRAHYLRSLVDSRSIIAAAGTARSAVVLGASFIGLEVAASLRARGLDVHVVAPSQRPLERILGNHLSAFILDLHEKHGVTFHMGHTAARILNEEVILDNGDRIQADLVVAGIGVTPRDDLASRAGIAVGDGILVNSYLETSAPGIYAAGDVARFPHTHTGEPIRIEHWAVAERQGQVAARNILGRRQPFDAVPFFWSQHYDVVISYVGHAAHWTDEQVAGSARERDCTITYRKGDQVLAVATIGRDRNSLEAELAMELGGVNSLPTGRGEA
jgi:NADPH-dependent 2,4-dienoyl-CoA reductase/sulfur reductase-like enzyme/nitrite reductase/ring-hydroxylating ferredoxin subunit